MQILAEPKQKPIKPEDKGPKYFINIEGVEHPWNSPTITIEQIAVLGGWANEGVIEIDDGNVEHNLVPGQVIELKPGHGFAKKVRWKRGDNIFDGRLANELKYLRGRFEGVKQDGMWFFIPNYPLNSGWNRDSTDIAFRVQSGYPATAPYGFFVPSGIKFNDQVPTNYQESVADRPPFEGQWGVFSWAPEDWHPSENLGAGFNLLNFALGFANRFREGA